MENPNTWGGAERVVNTVLARWHQETVSVNIPIGLSLARQITDALRKAGLLNEE